MSANARNVKLYEVMAAPDERSGSPIQRTLEAIRKHLEMDVAYLSKFDGDHWILHDYTARVTAIGLTVGQMLPRRQTVCGNIADGRLPRLIHDTASAPLAKGLQVTTELSIGAHIGTPIMMGGRTPWGMLCAYSFKPDPSLNPRDLSFMEAFAELIAVEIEREVRRNEVAPDRDGVAPELAADESVTLLQPIWALSTGTPYGAQAVLQFASKPDVEPALSTGARAAVRPRGEHELAAVRAALDGLVHLDPSFLLAIDIAPATIVTDGFRHLMRNAPLHRLQLDLTDPVPVADYGALRRAIAPLRGAGARVAVNGAGGGYASMTHILQLQPDVIRADMALTRNIDSDPGKQALVAALASFARAARATLLAEGILTAAELFELRRLGVELGQGDLLGNAALPVDVEDAFAAGAAAFRPALVRSGDVGNSPSGTRFDSLAMRKRFATLLDPTLGRWVV